MNTLDIASKSRTVTFSLNSVINLTNKDVVFNFSQECVGETSFYCYFWRTFALVAAPKDRLNEFLQKGLISF